MFIYSKFKSEVTCQNADFEAGTSELIPKKNRLKFVTLHSPFSFIRKKKYSKLNGHPEYFGIFYS